MRVLRFNKQEPLIGCWIEVDGKGGQRGIVNYEDKEGIQITLSSPPNSSELYRNFKYPFNVRIIRAKGKKRPTRRADARPTTRLP